MFNSVTYVTVGKLVRGESTSEVQGEHKECSD